jgi:methyl-accepting chemotaxis protein
MALFSPEASKTLALMVILKGFIMDAALLRTSFDLIAPEKYEFVEAFYQILFEKYPEVRPLFATTDMPRQVRILADILGAVVEGVEAGNDLTPTLKALGARHKKYGVSSEHYPKVADSLLIAFQKRLGSQWTPAYQAVWTEALMGIAQVMLS